MEGLNNMPTHGKAWTQPSRLSAAWFQLKKLVHIARRTTINLFTGPNRIPFGSKWIDAPIISEYRSQLWSGDRDDEFVLRCGKVQNLRVATRLIHGLELKAGDVFSFWKQVGRPTWRKGFVNGREIMSGCVVPTVGGGICQLTNALARCAPQAGLEFIEHHRHSALVEGQNPHDLQIDATVAWNHIDLRLRCKEPLRLEAYLTHDELVVRIRQSGSPLVPPSHQTTKVIPVTPAQGLPVARGCLTCEETTCFRHRSGAKPTQAKTALLLDTKTPEFEKWIHSQIGIADWMIPWHRGKRRGLAWDPPNNQSTYRAVIPSLRRTIALRMAAGEGGKLQTARQRSLQWLAHAYARQLKPEHTDLVVAQELLVPLWKNGVLGGRTFRVLASQLPMSEIQNRLDLALRIHPQASELQDFRAPNDWSDIEWRALSAAQLVITPHSEVVRCLRSKGVSVEPLDWVQPQETPAPAKRSVARYPTLCLAASALPRKGSLEVAAIAKSLNAQVLILGSPPTELSDWQGVNWRQVGYSGNWLAQADVVLLPAFIEHQPRALLQARANGIPVVATAGCGLSSLSGINWVAAGDADGLEKSVRHILGL